MATLAPLVNAGGEAPALAQDLARLDAAVEETRIRLRAEYMRISLSPRLPDEVKQVAIDWIRDGAPVDDELRYLAWLERRVPA